MSGRGDGLIGGGDDIVGEVDQPAPGWLWQRDQLIGHDLATRGPGDAFIAGLTLLDCDLGLCLGPHADDARGSGEARMVRCGVSSDVGNVNGRHDAEMKGFDSVGEVDAVGELFGRRPSGLIGGGSGDRGTHLAGCHDE